MSYYTKYVDKVKLKDTWEIVTRGLKWSELTQSQKNLFGKGMSTFNQQKVFQEWKNGLSKSDKNKAQDLQDDYLSKYDIKNWSNVSDKDREKFFDNKKSNYIDWYDENYAERDRVQKAIAANTPSKPKPEPQVQAPRPTGIGPVSQPSSLKIDPKPQVQAPAPTGIGPPSQPTFMASDGSKITPEVQAKAPTGIGPSSKPTMMLPDGNAVTGSYDEIAEAAGDDVPKSFLLNFQWSDLSPAQQAKFENKETFSERRAEKGFKSSPEDIFSKKLDVEGLDAALEEYSASQLLDFYNKGDLKIGKNALADVKVKADEEEGSVEIGGYGRIGEGRFTDRPAADPKNDTGVLYKTYSTGSGDDKFLKIGNLRGHRYEGSPYADIKIVDYDASIENYDPSKEGTSTSNFVESYGKKSGKIKFTKYKPQRQEYSADTFRTEAQRKDYAMRGISNGGRITKYKQDGVYKNIETNADGNLKRLTLDDNGNYKATTSKYPSAVRSNSFSDLLESKTGLKIGGSATREQRLASIKSQLSI